MGFAFAEITDPFITRIIDVVFQRVQKRAARISDILALPVRMFNDAPYMVFKLIEKPIRQQYGHADILTLHYLERNHREGLSTRRSVCVPEVAGSKRPGRSDGALFVRTFRRWRQRRKSLQCSGLC